MTGAEPDPARKAGPVTRNRTLKIVIPLALLGIALCVFGLGGFILLGDRFGDLIRSGGSEGLSIDRDTFHGTVGGEYRYPDDMGGWKVQFHVQADGHAQFYSDADPSKILTVDPGDEGAVNMTWAGVTLDGQGALTDQEQSILSDLMASDLLHGLSMIPLDVACLGPDEISDNQVAALLFPLQMRFKYQIPDRQAAASDLIALSRCDYSSGEGNQAKQPTVIQLTPAMPVPVVFGYFPFDEVGAVEPEASLDPAAKLACLGPSAVTPADQGAPVNPLIGRPVSVGGPIVNEWGYCGAMCRGACGSDCTRENCTRAYEWRCEQDAMGQNTGNKILMAIYDCGVHQACFDHDACYDQCNKTWGCKTWAAAYCRHARLLPDMALDDLRVQPLLRIAFCDQRTTAEWGFVDALAWSQGHGPQPMRQVYEYLMDYPGSGPDLEMCPLPMDEDSEGEEPPLVTPAGPQATPGEEQPPLVTPAAQVLDPCAVMPPGGRLGRVDENTCFATFSTEPAGRTVQLGLLYPQVQPESACQSMAQGSDYHTVIGEWPLGVCGYLIDANYKGEKVGGYTGWSIYFVLDRFTVRVATNQEFPANKDWVVSTAEEIEQNIRTYLSQGGD
jgi:hypothetical protein